MNKKNRTVEIGEIRCAAATGKDCGLFYPLDCGLEGSPLNKGRPLVLRSGTVSEVGS